MKFYISWFMVHISIEAWLARRRVAMGFLLAVGALYFGSACNLLLIYGGLPLIGAGLALRGWAAGHIRKDRELATTGPYALVRHPLYLGSLLITAGFCVLLTCPSRLGVSALIWASAAIFFSSVYRLKMIGEENYMAEKFPREWAPYTVKTGRLTPNSWPQTGRLKGGFSWKQWIYNREFNALLGAVAALIFFLCK